MAESMTDILNGQSRSDIDTHDDMCKMAESIPDSETDDRHIEWYAKTAESIPDSGMVHVSE